MKHIECTMIYEMMFLDNILIVNFDTQFNILFAFIQNF